MEELLDEKHPVCINDDRNTIIDVNAGKESVLDLMRVILTLAPLRDWHVHQEGIIGIDQHPIYSTENIATIQTKESIGGKCIFKKAKWGIS